MYKVLAALDVYMYTWTTEGSLAYPKKAYNVLLHLQRQTWACKVRNVFYTFGFGVVWEMQGVGTVNSFVRVF